MEEWLLDFLKVGVLPLVGVFGGLAWSGRREKQNRKNDQDRDDKNSQRVAVAKFIRAVNELNISELTKLDLLNPAHKAETLTYEEIVKFLSITNFHYRNFLTEIRILDLHLHDPYVRKHLEILRQVVLADKELHESSALSTRFAGEKKLTQEKIEARRVQLAKIALTGSDRHKFEPYISRLQEEARVRLRLKTAGGDEHPPMFTPPS